MSHVVSKPVERESTTRRADPALTPRQRGAQSARVRVALLAFDSVATIALLSLMRDGGGHAAATGGSWPVNVGLVGATGVAILALGAFGAYDPASRLPGSRLRTSVQLVVIACAAAVLAALISGGSDGPLDADCLARVVVLLPSAWIGARVIASIVERRNPARTVVVGTGITAEHVWRLSARHPECAFQVIGFVDDEPLSLPHQAPATLGRLEDLPRLVHEHAVECVIVAYARVNDADLLAVLRALEPNVRVQVVPRLYELVQARGFELGRISVLDAGGATPSAGERRLKRVFDLVVSMLLLVLVTPLLVTIAIAIKLEDRGPVLFRQRRVGRHNEVFGMLKFRTMAEGAEQQGYDMVEDLPIENAVRELKTRSVELHVTRIGRRLRALSLDELPQLWNVVRGQMALVGPRPMPEYEAEALSEWQEAVRHAVRPGITGLWQVSGRSSISWDERIQLDCVYARHWSVTTDIRILLRTVAAVVRTTNTV